MMDESAQRVLQGLARVLVGSHYLTGGYGAMPGMENGAPHRPGGIRLVSPPRFDVQNACIYAAEFNATEKVKKDGKEIVRDLHSVCGGRWVAAQAPYMGEWETATYLKIQKEQYEKVKRVDPLLDRYTPRVTVLKTKSGGVVWGEDCRGIRHFDCVGLVNYLLTKVANRSKLPPTGFSGSVAWHKQNTARIDRNDPPVSGDILTFSDDSHIALLLRNGNVIQAASPELGVTLTPYLPETWSYRGRHGDGKFWAVDRDSFDELDRPRHAISL